MLGALSILFAKIVSIAGIGSLLAGLFAKNRYMATIFAIALAIIDTMVLASIREAAVGWPSLKYALAAALLTGHLAFTLQPLTRRLKGKRPNKSTSAASPHTVGDKSWRWRRRTNSVCKHLVGWSVLVGIIAALVIPIPEYRGGPSVDFEQWYEETGWRVFPDNKKIAESWHREYNQKREVEHFGWVTLITILPGFTSALLLLLFERTTYWLFIRRKKLRTEIDQYAGSVKQRTNEWIKSGFEQE